MKFDRSYEYLSVKTNEDDVKEYFKNYCKEKLNVDVEVEVKVFKGDVLPYDIGILDELVQIRMIEK